MPRNELTQWCVYAGISNKFVVSILPMLIIIVESLLYVQHISKTDLHPIHRSTADPAVEAAAAEHLHESHAAKEQVQLIDLVS